MCKREAIGKYTGCLSFYFFLKKENKMSEDSKNSKVKVYKQSEGKKFFKLFFTGSFLDALKYAFNSVFVPITKDTIVKTSTNVVNYWVNGDKPSQIQNNNPRVSYWNPGNSNKQNTSIGQSVSVKANSPIHLDDYEVNDRGIAERILLEMYDTLKTYPSVKVGDYKELFNNYADTDLKILFTDYNYGWKNLDGVTVVPGRNIGWWKIALPQPIPLKYG